MSADISVIIPTLNEAAIIERSLSALQTFRARGVEIIVADGGSTDGSAALCKPYADRIVQAPRGRASQMNAGAATARCSVLLFLHADSTLPLDAVALIRDGLETTGCQWGRFDVMLEGGSGLLKVIAFMMNLRSRLTGIATGDQGIFTTRSLFNALGGFPVLPLMEDVTFSRRAKRMSPPLCLRAKIVTSARRWEKHGLVRTVLLMWRLRLEYFFGADPARLAVRYQSVRGRD